MMMLTTEVATPTGRFSAFHLSRSEIYLSPPMLFSSSLLSSPFHLNLVSLFLRSVFHIILRVLSSFNRHCLPLYCIQPEQSIMAPEEYLRVTDQGSRYDCLLFDLDDTVYPLNSGLTAACTKNTEDYMVQKLRIEESGVQVFNKMMFETYGTSMAGLRARGHEFDYDEYHSFVHGRLPYENLKPDPVLKNLLLSMPQRKIVFTNGDKVHAAKVLEGLGLEDCFEGIICFETLNPPTKITESNNEGDVSTDNSTIPKTPIICKPSKEAMDKAISLANADPQRTIFFDDSRRNIAAGKRAGLHTVLVGTSVRSEGADLALECIHNIREALPEIWEEEGAESSKNAVPSMETIENVVIA